MHNLDLISRLRVQAVSAFGPEGFELLTEAAEALARSTAMVNTELEKAALICERVNNFDNPMTAGDCADAIRALKV